MTVTYDLVFQLPRCPISYLTHTEREGNRREEGRRGGEQEGGGEEGRGGGEGDRREEGRGTGERKGGESAIGGDWYNAQHYSTRSGRSLSD